jgi:hypothetical protein
MRLCVCVCVFEVDQVHDCDLRCSCSLSVHAPTISDCLLLRLWAWQKTDPMHEEDYRKEFLHVDGSIQESVLWLLQQNSPFGAGVSP